MNIGGYITYGEDIKKYRMKEHIETTLEELQAMVGNKPPDNTDLIKRIETLEKQMSMIEAYNMPLNAPPFKPETKY